MQANLVTLDAVLGKTYDSEVCSAARALELVGERWSLLIIRNALFAGATRYSDFRTPRHCDEHPPKPPRRLRRRRDHGAAPPAAPPEYLLTDKGRELASVIVALTERGYWWAAPDSTSPFCIRTPSAAVRSVSRPPAPPATKCTTLQRSTYGWDPGMPTSR